MSVRCDSGKSIKNASCLCEGSGALRHGRRRHRCTEVWNADESQKGSVGDQIDESLALAIVVCTTLCWAEVRTV